MAITAAKQKDDTPQLGRIKSDWLRIAVAILAGVMAAASIGKIPPSLGAIQAEFGLNAAAGGTLAGLFNIVAALVGAVAGALSVRFSARQCVKLALLVLSGEGVLSTFAESAALIMTNRVLGGLGFILLVVSVPRLLRQNSSLNDSKLVFGLWGTFMPSGIALTLLLFYLLPDDFGWRHGWLLVSAAQLVVFAVFHAVFRNSEQENLATPGTASSFSTVARQLTPWIIGLTFLCYSAQWITMMTWLPSLLGTMNSSLPFTGLGAVFVIGANIIGNIAGAIWMRKTGRRFTLLASVFLGLAFSIFAAFEVAQSIESKLALMLLFSLLGGMIPATLLEAATSMARHPSDISTMHGFTMQGSNIGALAGPPILGLLFDLKGDWAVMWPFAAIASALGIVAAGLLYRLEQTQKPQ